MGSDVPSHWLPQAAVRRRAGFVLFFFFYKRKTVFRLTDFFHVPNFTKIMHILSRRDVEKPVHVIVTSRLDFCTSSVSPMSLERLSSCCTCSDKNSCYRTYFSLNSLHWIPVKFRTENEILVLTYIALNGQDPTYLKDLIVPTVLSGRRVTKSRMGAVTLSVFKCWL